MATLSTHVNHCTAHQPIMFDKVKVSIGSGFNDQHGNFIAPVPGLYAFSTTISVDPQSSYHVAIVQGNASNEIGYLIAGYGAGWNMRSTTVFSHLNTGEDVWVICLSNSTIRGGTYGIAQEFHSHFSGFLVSED